MENFIIIAVVVLAVGLAVRYIYKSKKMGKRCVGCSACSDSCGENCSCGKK